MIQDHIKAAILALVESDTCATDADKESVKRALGGKKSSYKIYSLREVARLTGKHRNTINNMVKNGTLKAVRGSGDRVIGISEDTLERMM